ncbi:hypothetical protein PV371_35995 [Streptomyces sp. TX20-6-3]|uniref:hypothetical protein n=1 Tax=Streptomyces sp. TX20-6-3 TaxID=3028705 RepID=UPI0029BDE8A6|nr:hypothetical protein [Streptomyces sp. TX20-6-3]MDX2565029.1 hypothetical protein [Streptomyces sp. TX20-6-3]
MQLKDTEFRIGTFHGRHDGAPVKITAVRDDTRPEPYFWRCSCGAGRSFPTEEGVFPSAWRHTHPTRLDRLRQWTARRLRTRRAR